MSSSYSTSTWPYYITLSQSQEKVEKDITSWRKRLPFDVLQCMCLFIFRMRSIEYVLFSNYVIFHFCNCFVIYLKNKLLFLLLCTVLCWYFKYSTLWGQTEHPLSGFYKNVIFEKHVYDEIGLIMSFNDMKRKLVGIICQFKTFLIMLIWLFIYQICWSALSYVHVFLKMTVLFSFILYYKLKTLQN